MSELIENFNRHKSIASDINEHLEVLKNIAEECNHITEMGVRWGSSTVAFLSAKPKNLISYDIKKLPEIDHIVYLAKKESIDYVFLEKDVLQIDIDDTDLLFIDTLHTYNQLINELEIHSNKVKKYIILHDTETFGTKDEIIYSHASNLIKNKPNHKSGLMNALKDFLETDKGLVWEIHKHYSNNNGLTILKKK